MKKTSKFIISIFILLFTVIQCFYFSSNPIKAAISGIEVDETVFFESINNSRYNKITVSKKGKIEISYAYGFTEIMMVIQRCKEYNDRGTACKDFATSKDELKIIHVGGDYNDAVDDNGNRKPVAVKTIHLFNYFDYDEIVRVEFYGSFINAEISNDTRESAYKYLFYDIDATQCGESNEWCVEKGDHELKNHMTVLSRVGRYLCDVDNPAASQNYNMCLASKIKNIEMIGNRVYQGDSPTISDRNTINANTTDRKVGLLADKQSKMPLPIQIDNSKVDDGSATVDNIIYDTIIPAMITLLIIAAGATIAILGYKIVKSSDEPQERQDSINKLRNILLGIAFVLVILFALKPIVRLMEKLIGE